MKAPEELEGKRVSRQRFFLCSAAALITTTLLLNLPPTLDARSPTPGSTGGSDSRGSSAGRYTPGGVTKPPSGGYRVPGGKGGAGTKYRVPRPSPGPLVVPGPKKPRIGPYPVGEKSKKKERKVAAPQKPHPPLIKLVRPRAAYLSELAMDYSRTFAERAQRDPTGEIKQLKSALEKAGKRKDGLREWEALARLGHVYYLIGRFTKAVEHYETALEKARDLRDPAREGRVLRNLGAVHTAWGQYPTAGDMNRKALRIFIARGNVNGIQMTLNNMGILEKNRGRYDEALENFEQALRAHDPPNRFRVVILKNLGSFYARWGEEEKAVEHYRQAVDAARRLGDPMEEGDTLVAAAQAHAQSDLRKPEALNLASQAVDVFKRNGAPTDSPMKLMGDIFLDMGQLDKAEPYVTAAGYGSSLGRFHLLTWQTDQARQLFEQVVKAAQEEENFDELFAAYTGLGRVFEITKHYQQARNYYQKALEITEELRAGLLLSERKNFYAVAINGFARSEPARGLIRVTFKQNRPEQSIHAGETTRAREFADNLAQKAEGSTFGVPPDVLLEEEGIANKLASLMAAKGVLPPAADKERFAELTTQIKQAQSEQKRFVQKLRANYKDYASIKYPIPVKLEECSVAPTEYVLLFDLLGEGVGIRLIKGKRVVKAVFSEWDPHALEEDVRRFRRPFEQGRLHEFDSQLAAELYRKLLAEPLKLVPQGSLITIIPDGLLALLPFEALIQYGGGHWEQNQTGPYLKGVTYVGDLYPITYYQSLTTLTLTRRLPADRPARARVLVMADPVFDTGDSRAQGVGRQELASGKDGERTTRTVAVVQEGFGGKLRLSRLRGTQDLARNLKAAYGPLCDVYTGLSCTKDLLLSEVSRQGNKYGSMVFATHGFASNHIPGIMEPVLAFTMVPLGRDGLLTMSEVAGMKFKVDVAALTACQTGVGIKLAGEGVLSMGRAFQCAGARSVIVSLWSVSEEPSVMLMDEFFRARKGGKSKLEAWTQARNHLREAGFKHPFFWASFVLVGERD